MAEKLEHERRYDPELGLPYAMPLVHAPAVEGLHFLGELDLDAALMRNQASHLRSGIEIDGVADRKRTILESRLRKKEGFVDITDDLIEATALARRYPEASVSTDEGILKNKPGTIVDGLVRLHISRLEEIASTQESLVLHRLVAVIRYNREHGLV
jgi:hypothetical protein